MEDVYFSISCQKKNIIRNKKRQNIVTLNETIGFGGLTFGNLIFQVLLDNTFNIFGKILKHRKWCDQNAYRVINEEGTKLLFWVYMKVHISQILLTFDNLHQLK